MEVALLSFRRRRMLVALAATAAVTLAGCGGGGGSSGGGGGTPSSSEPIKVMSWAPLANPKVAFPQVKAAAEARVRAINDAGGIRGHRLELVFCDTNYDPNTEAGCARQAQQEKAAAVVGAFTSFPGTYSVLERAGIPAIGTIGLFSQELSSPVSYPLAGGVPAWYTGAVTELRDAGAKTLGLVVCNSPACSYAGKIVEDVVPRAGLRLTAVGTVPTGTPDPSAAVAQAIAGTPDGVVLALPPSSIPKVVQALRAAHYGGKIASVSSVFPSAILRALGSAADGILLTSQVKPLSETSDPAIAQFGKELSAASPSTGKDESAEIAWGAFVLFEKLAGKLGTVNASTVQAALRGLDKPIGIGITAPYSTVGKTSPVADAPRLFNPTVYYNHIENGVIVASSDTAVNPFAGLAAGS